MDISRLSYAGVALALATACMLGLDADAAPDSRPLVLYVGHYANETDFRQFKAALDLAHPLLESEVRLEFVGGPDNSNESQRRPFLRGVVARKPVLVIAPNGSTAEALREVAPTMPVVFSSFDDPVHAHIVTTMKPRPEPITGISLFDALDGKRMEILHEAYPNVRSVAVLADDSWAGKGEAMARVSEQARRDGIYSKLFTANTLDQAEEVLARAEVRSFDAWYVPATYVEYQALKDDLVIARMRAWHRPCIFATTEQVENGGAMAYVQDTTFAWPALAELAARVLGGEAPGGIPVMRPQRFVLALRTNPDTQVPLPDIGVVRQADRVIR